MNIFLSVPFTGKVDAYGAVLPDYQTPLADLLAALRTKGHEVYCSLEYSDWRYGGITSPEAELAHDFAEVGNAEVIIALLEEDLSAGVQLELGYAYATGKQIELFQIGQAAWSNNAFSKIIKRDIVPVQSVDDFAAQVLARY